MRHIVLILFIGVVAVFSCDGRITKQEALKNSVIQFKDTTHTTEVIEYFPRAYAEIKTDTILNNGYRVKIKNFTDMNASVLETTTVNNINYKRRFRQVKSEIIVYKNDKLIFKDIVDNKLFQNYLSGKINPKDYLNNGIGVDEILSLETNKLVLVSSFCIPKGADCPSYKMVIDENGNCDYKTIDYART